MSDSARRSRRSPFDLTKAPPAEIIEIRRTTLADELKLSPEQNVKMLEIWKPVGVSSDRWIADAKTIQEQEDRELIEKILTEEQREQIFRPFYTTRSDGTGLGLSLVRRIVEEHYGRIHVKSEPGNGSTFEVLLPFSHVADVVDA